MEGFPRYSSDQREKERFGRILSSEGVGGV